MAGERPGREVFRHFYALSTRWSDNDVYGHVNNVVFYAYFDSIANRYLIEHCGLDIHGGDLVGYVVSSGCEYHAPVAYPDSLEGALRVDYIGTSSVRYGLAVFRAGEPLAAAHGHFVHVFVDRRTGRPVPLPATFRAPLERILATPSDAS